MLVVRNRARGMRSCTSLKRIHLTREVFGINTSISNRKLWENVEREAQRANPIIHSEIISHPGNPIVPADFKRDWFGPVSSATELC